MKFAWTTDIHYPFAEPQSKRDEFLQKLTEVKGSVSRAAQAMQIERSNLYRKMKQAGCTMLDFGIESGNPDILRRIHKNITLSQARRAIAAAKSAGLRVVSAAEAAKAADVIMIIGSNAAENHPISFKTRVKNRE
jgi:radical SAM superfamily enzyme YgiQ (UPF0313 family)